MFLFVADPFMGLNQLTVLAGIGFVGGLYLFIRGFRVLARKRLLINTPTSKIRSASLGLVEVSGTAVGPYTLHTPIAGIPCFLYRTTVWQKSDEGRNKEWKKVAEETLHVPFFLDDGTGQLLINPQGAELDLHRDLRRRYGDTIFSPQAGGEVLSFLARHGARSGDNIRIEECSIRPESHLFIVGTLAENPGVEVAPVAQDLPNRNAGLGIRLGAEPIAPPPREVIRLSEPTPAASAAPQSQQSKVAAALMKAGITNPAAWEAAGVTPSEIAVADTPRVSQISINGKARPQPEESAAFDLHPPVVLMKGENDPSFLISWQSQRELVRSLAWKSAGMIWGGAGLVLLALYVVLKQMEML